jgi:hypothetical protein
LSFLLDTVTADRHGTAPPFILPAQS